MACCHTDAIANFLLVVFSLIPDSHYTSAILFLNNVFRIVFLFMAGL